MSQENTSNIRKHIDLINDLLLENVDIDNEDEWEDISPEELDKLLGPID